MEISQLSPAKTRQILATLTDLAKLKELGSLGEIRLVNVLIYDGLKSGRKVSPELLKFLEEAITTPSRRGKNITANLRLAWSDTLMNYYKKNRQISKAKKYAQYIVNKGKPGSQHDGYDYAAAKRVLAGK